ncbi:MAG: Ig-like domain-containing protein, partial [Leptospiraceae bacterium]|nr:Ig-like domain-containing protein [Leptospiraceae bacterium]
MKIKNSNIVCILALLLLVACGAEDNLLESLLLPGEDAAGLERPEVVFVGPATGSTGVTLNTNIIITYSKAMDPILTQSALQLQAGGGATSAEPFWLSDRSVQYTVSPSLSAAKRYSITIVSSLARDTDGNYLAINYLSHFYTLGAGTAPQVTSANPGLESAIQFGWGLNQDPVINFSVPMDPQATGDAVTVSGGPARFIRQWSNNNTTLTLNMQDPLQANVTYTLKVASGAKSADGISITSPKTYLFHTGTDTVQPALNSVTSGTFVWPALVAYPTLNTITGVSKNSAFLFDFSEAMDPSSTIEAISFDPPIGGQFSWLTPTQLQFQPTNPLVTGATYRMAIESSATDAQGLTLPNRYLTDFTVDDPLDSVPITLVEVRGYTPGPDTADGSFGTAGTITGTP